MQNGLKTGLLPAVFTLVLGLSLTTSAQSPTSDPVVINGQTEPSRRVEVPSVLRGQLIRVSVKEGQAIRKGDEIAALDDSIQRQVVAFAKLEAESTVDIRQAESQVAFTVNELERYQKIAGSGSAAELRQRQLAVDQSKLELEKRKEAQQKKQLDLEREQATIEKMIIRSPLDGSVLRVNRQPGELVDIDKPIAIIVQTTTLAARFYPPRQLFGRIHVGDTIAVEIKSDPPATRQATVTVVDPILDAASQLFQVKVEFPNADQSIPAGTSATWTWTK